MTALPDLSLSLTRAADAYFFAMSESIMRQFGRDERVCGFCDVKLSDKMRRLRHEWYCHIRELFPTD